MILNINNKNYTLRYNLLSRIKLSQIFESEKDMIEYIEKKDLKTLILFIMYCIQDEITEDEFLNSYPMTKDTEDAFYEIALNIIKEAIDPFGIDEQYKNTKKEDESLKNDFRALLIEIMSKGYTQEQVLNMTNWDISLIFKADYKKLEREVFHTNEIINTLIAVNGGKARIDILQRNKKVENLENKYPLESAALNLLHSIRNNLTNEVAKNE